MTDTPPGMRTINLDPDEPDTATGTTESTDTDTDTGFGFEQEERKRTPELRRMESDLANLYTQVAIIGGIAGGTTGNIAGTIIARRSTDLAGSWIDLAERDPRIRRAIKSVLAGGGWAGVIAVHVGVILPVAAVAGVLPRPVAEKVMLGLALQDPDLMAFIQANAYTEPTAENGATG